MYCRCYSTAYITRDQLGFAVSAVAADFCDPVAHCVVIDCHPNSNKYLDLRSSSDIHCHLL